VHAGTLGGSGTVTGAVTVGTGSGPGASLAPAAGGRPSNFTTTNAITFQADGTYTCVVRARGTRIQTDRIIASRVTINGATFAFRPRFSGALPAGSVLTIINNTGASPISGTFSNLADAAIITANGTNFQANYEGGDGMIRP
jgi:hypothetical protein